MAGDFFRVCVCGSRTFANRDWLFHVLDTLDGRHHIYLIATGDAAGADECARAWARERGRRLDEFAADWRQYGRSAGPRRNAMMLNAANPDVVVAFPGNGRGTWDTIGRARARGIMVLMADTPDVVERIERMYAPAGLADA